MESENKKLAVRDQFVIQVPELRNRPFKTEREIPHPLLTGKLRYLEYEAVPESASVKIKAESCGAGVLVQGEIAAHINTNCSTCLEDTSIRLSLPLSTFMLPKSEAEENPDDRELTPEDLKMEWFEDDTIVLDDMLLDMIMLEMPMNPKCGSSCPGPPNYNDFPSKPEIDPRLAPLANLRIEKEK